MEGKESAITAEDRGRGGGAVIWRPSSSSSSSSRPRLSLPLRLPSIEEQGLYMKGSPGPMTTLFSSLMSDHVDPDPDTDSECRSFSQLLAGAMSSPNAHPTAASAMMMMMMYSPSEATLGAQNNTFDEGGAGGLGNASGNGRGLRGFKSSTPTSIPIPMSPLFTVPAGFSPTMLLDSPGFLSGGQGPFGISHQQVLAQVQAQAQVQALPQMQVQASSYAPLMPSTSTAIMPLQTEYTAATDDNTYGTSRQQTMPAQPESNKTIGCPELVSQTNESDQRSLPPIHPVAERPSDDGYNWRKYGQKQVKGSEYPRSYYKCTHPKCPVKKKVERSHDGQVTEIVYKGDHSHSPKPQSSRRMSNAAQKYLSAQDGRYASHGSDHDDKNGILDGKTDGSFQLFSGDPRGRRGINTNISDPSTSAREHDVGQRSAEQLCGSSDDGEDDDQVSRLDNADDDDEELDAKRRKKEENIKEIVALNRTIKEPRVVVQTTSDVDILDDGYRWRKYGQKVVKGNPHPRSYYKCTNVGCSVRKHVERASTDVRAVITTYEGKHNHDVPAPRNSSHDSAGPGSQFHAGNNAVTSCSLPKPSTISLLEQKAGNCPSSSAWTLESRTEGQDMNSRAKEGPLSVHTTQNYVANMDNFTSSAASNIASNQIIMERPFPNDCTFSFTGAIPLSTLKPKEEHDTTSVATGFYYAVGQ